METTQENNKVWISAGWAIAGPVGLLMGAEAKQPSLRGPVSRDRLQTAPPKRLGVSAIDVQISPNDLPRVSSVHRSGIAGASAPTNLLLGSRG
ncbi:unnamed protein product [Arctogadus glacialis]